MPLVPSKLIRRLVGIALFLAGAAMLSGKTQVESPGGLIAGGLMAVAGALIWLSAFVDFGVRPTRPEQKWEPVADNGIFHAIQGRWDDAMAEFHKAMDMAATDPRRLRAGERIGGYLEQRHKTREALPFFVKALEARTRMYGAEHPATKQLRERIAGRAIESGDGDMAVRMLQEQLHLVAPWGRITSLEAARTAARLAEALLLVGDIDNARAASQDAIAAIESIDPYNVELVDALLTDARIHLETSDPKGAEPLLQRALENAQRVGSRARTDRVRRELLDVYMANGRFEEAVPISEKLVSGTNVAASRTPEENADLVRRHAELLERAGRPDEAARYRRTAETLERLVNKS